MSRDKRRSERITGSVEICLSLREIASGQILAGPISGKIDNISQHGIGIALSRIRIEKYHFFYSILDTSELELFMEALIPDESNEKIVISLRPVWFDRDLSCSAWPFVMGLEFSSGSEDEQVQVLSRSLTQRENWGNSWCRCLMNRFMKFFG